MDRSLHPVVKSPLINFSRYQCQWVLNTGMGKENENWNSLFAQALQELMRIIGNDWRLGILQFG